MCTYAHKRMQKHIPVVLEVSGAGVGTTTGAMVSSSTAAAGAAAADIFVCVCMLRCVCTKKHTGAVSSLRSGLGHNNGCGGFFLNGCGRGSGSRSIAATQQAVKERESLMHIIV